MSIKRPVFPVILSVLLIVLALVLAGAGCRARALVSSEVPEPSRVLDVNGETITFIAAKTGYLSPWTRFPNICRMPL